MFWTSNPEVDSDNDILFTKRAYRNPDQLMGNFQLKDFDTFNYNIQDFGVEKIGAVNCLDNGHFLVKGKSSRPRQYPIQDVTDYKTCSDRLMLESESKGNACGSRVAPISDRKLYFCNNGRYCDASYHCNDSYNGVHYPDYEYNAYVQAQKACDTYLDILIVARGSQFGRNDRRVPRVFYMAEDRADSGLVYFKDKVNSMDTLVMTNNFKSEKPEYVYYNFDGPKILYKSSGSEEFMANITRSNSVHTDN